MDEQIITQPQELLPVRVIKSKKPLSPLSLTGKRKDGAPKQQKLNTRQVKFIKNWLTGKSARKAALDAGYSESLANNASTDLLGNPQIADEIRRISQTSAKLREVTPEMIIDNLTRLATSNTLDYGEYEVGPNGRGRFRVDLAQISRDQGYAIQEISTDPNGDLKIKLVDKLAANMALARIKKMGMPGDVTIDPTGQTTIQQLDAIVHQITFNQTVNNNIQNNSFPQSDGKSLPPGPAEESV